MHCKPFHTLFFIGILFLGLSQSSWALEDLPRPEEVKLLALINEARRAPLDMAARLGMDPAKVLADFPEWADVLKSGLPPLVLNQALEQAAKGHNQDMLERNYYASLSPEGEGPLERISRAGYLPGRTGESLGLITFLNFVSPDDAVWFIFSNLFADELATGEKERNILAPDMEEIGIAVSSGKWLVAGVVANAYVATCDFAGNSASRFARMLAALINEARAHPLAMARALGMDETQLLESLPDMKDVLLNGVPPLAWNDQLFEASKEHAWDMLKRGYYSDMSPEGEGPAARATRHGYLPLMIGESLRLLMLADPQTPMDAAWRLFKEMFLRELSPEWLERNILSPDFTEMGVAFLQAGPEELEQTDSDFAPYYNSLMVVDFAARETDEGPWLCGRVYRDHDQNGLYGPGEGLAGVTVLITGAGVEKSMVTDAAGSFELSVAPGSYSIRVYGADGSTEEKWVDVGPLNGDVSFSLP